VIFLSLSPPQQPPLPEDPAWVRSLRRREPAAWEQLQQRALDAVYGYLVVRTGRREDAEDLTAEVFAAAVGAIEGFRGDARVETWLLGIARRKWLDSLRRAGRRPREAALPDGFTGEWEHPHAAVERREELRRVREGVRALPDLQREALWLHCVDQLSLAETARLLGRSEDAVKGLIRRARLALRERLAEGETALRPEGARSERKETNHVEPAVLP